MASGDILAVLSAWDGFPAMDTSSPQLKTIAGGSSDLYHVAAFDDTTTEYLDFYSVMPNHYDGGGLTCTVIFTHANNSSGPSWYLGFRRMQDDVDNMTSNHTYVYNSVAATVPDTVGKIGYADITFTDGADMDSIATGEYFVSRIYRDVATGGTGDANLLCVYIKET